MFSHLSLRYRIALVIFILEACMLAAVLGVTLMQTRQTAAGFDAASQEASLDLLANLSVTALLTSEYSDFQLYLDDVRKQPSIVRIVLADPRQRVVASRRVTDVGAAMAQSVDNREPGWRMQPVVSAAGTLGTLAVQFSDAALLDAHRKTRNLAFVIAIAGMLIIAFVGLITGFALTRRLLYVAGTARQFAAGDMSARSRVAGHDEVAVLSRNVDRMADAVVEQQEKLRAQSEYIRLLLASTAEAIYGVDTEGLCTFVNPACLAMLGYASEGDVVGRKIHDLIHHTYPDGRPYPAAECRVQISTREGKPVHAADEVHWRADGTSFSVEYWSHPMYQSGKLLGAVVTFIDITERKRAEAELREINVELEDRVEQRTAELVAAKDEAERANLAKSEFLSLMSHELRTPLNAVLGFSQLLEQEDITGKQRESVRQIMRGGWHLLELINEVLDLARIEAGKLTVSIEEVQVAPLLNECLTLIQPLAEARGIRILESGKDCIDSARADHTRLKQVLLNLLSNAVKYNRDKGTVEIVCEKAGNVIRIRITDSGAGLSDEQVARLFAPFERLGADRSLTEGTGIGLALSKRLMDLMQGRIGVESLTGAGSTFWIELPAALDVQEAAAAPAAVTPVQSVKYRAPAVKRDVLCIEDNPANLRLIELILSRREDIRLLTASQPSLGLDLAQAHRPALILLDINLPGMDGYAVFEHLRARVETRDIPVVAISANAMPKDLARGKAAGFADYVTKPIDVNRLLEAVDKVMEGLGADTGLG